jgi:hypothetical protein
MDSSFSANVELTTDAGCAPAEAVAPASGAISNLDELAQTAFHHAPQAMQRVVFDVPYVQLDDRTGGRLWVTQHGWRHLQQLDPAAWFLDGQYSQRGRQLDGGTGSVFRVPGVGPQHRPFDLVVKFSRMAQEILLDASALLSGELAEQAIEGAAVNDPFQEFGFLEELRTSRYGPADLRILTKRPLAIYSPAKSFESWQLGRTSDRFHCHRCRLDMDQAKRAHGLQAVEMSIQRQYIMLFHWVNGEDAEQLLQQGVVSAPEVRRLVLDVVNDLAAKGFRVLDTKPNHIILRHRPGKGLLRRGPRPVYALVDFELLQRTEEYERWRQTSSPDERRLPSTTR